MFHPILNFLHAQGRIEFLVAPRLLSIFKKENNLSDNTIEEDVVFNQIKSSKQKNSRRLLVTLSAE
jgi:hypothetical protein